MKRNGFSWSLGGPPPQGWGQRHYGLYRFLKAAPGVCDKHLRVFRHDNCGDPTWTPQSLPHAHFVDPALAARAEENCYGPRGGNKR